MTEWIIERGHEVITTGNTKEELLDKLDEIYDFTASETDEEIVLLDGIKVKKSYYDEVMAQRQAQREAEFGRMFFNTSLGWVKRKCFMAGTGETKDFLTDILPQLVVGFEIITYSFMATEQNKVRVTEQFIAECKQQLTLDFYPVQAESEE